MMKSACRTILLMFLLAIVSGSGVWANTGAPETTTEYTKTIKKNYKMSPNGDVTLKNKYGHIELKTWNRNEVKIDVTITVKARNESSANGIFERINVDFSNGSDYVKAETNIETSKSNWYKNGEKGDFRIDYEVSMPDGASLDLSNKYGDANIADLGGNAKVSVKYGSFTMGNVGKGTSVYLGYGGGKIGNVNDVDINVQYSKLKLNNADNVNMESKYSKVYIESADKMNCTSRYDSYDIGKLESLSNQGKYDHFEIEQIDRINVYSKYADFEVDELYKSAEFEMKNGGVIIEDLKKGFEEVVMNLEYVGCKIYVSDNASYRLDAEGKHASIYFPDELRVSSDQKNNSTRKVKGQKGNGGGVIRARLSYGGLKIK